jgi:uroporphyrinogen decarboxylase
MRALLGDIVWLPTLWEVVHPKFEWYWEFGYENYLLFMQLYPEAAGRFFASLAAVARLKAAAVARLAHELDLVPLTLIGTDICGGTGPVVSPALLREHYFPHVRYSLEPLHEAGFRTVWHSDGDIRPLVDDILACGVAGFQGFQEEYGVVPKEIVRKRTREGHRLTIFRGSSATRTLPYGSPSDVRREVERIVDETADESAFYFIFTNHALPDVPTENIVEAYRTAREYRRQAPLVSGGEEA